MLILSNCTNVSGDGTEEDKDDLILMPSISRGATRGHADNVKKEEEKPSTQESKTPAPNKEKVPTKAQQEAALEALSKPTGSQTKTAVPTPAPAPVTEPVAVPVPVARPTAPQPTSMPEEEEDSTPAPRPNSVELRGFRTPTLPSVLPMDVKG